MSSITLLEKEITLEKALNWRKWYEIKKRLDTLRGVRNPGYPSDLQANVTKVVATPQRPHGALVRARSNGI